MCQRIGLQKNGKSGSARGKMAKKFILPFTFFYGRMNSYESKFGLLTDKVENHEGAEFWKADRLGNICEFAYVALFLNP